MTKYILITLLLLSAASAQQTTVTATITDPNGMPYQYCKGSVAFVNQNTTPGSSVPTLGGSVTGTFQTEVPIYGCNGFGTFTVHLADNNQILPGPSQWKFTICDNSGLYCFSSLQTVTGATQNLTTALSSIAPPLPLLGNASYLGGHTWLTAPSITSSTTGTFSNSAFSFNFQSLVNGCNPSTLYPLEQGNSVYTSDADTSCIIAPTTATSWGVNGYDAFVVNNSTQAPTNVVHGVGITPACWLGSPGNSGAYGAGAVCEGANPVAIAYATSGSITGVEADLDLAGGAGTQSAVNVIGFEANAVNWQTDPSVSIGYNCLSASSASGASPATAYPWFGCYTTQTGATNFAVYAGAIASGSTQNSQYLAMGATSANNKPNVGVIYTEANGTIAISPPAADNYGNGTANTTAGIVLATQGAYGNVAITNTAGAGSLYLPGDSYLYGDGSGNATLSASTVGGNVVIQSEGASSEVDINPGSSSYVNLGPSAAVSYSGEGIFKGGLQVGTTSTAVVNTILIGADTLSFGAINSQTCAESTITITGASTTNNGVMCSPRATLGSTNLSWSSWVSSTNTISVRVCNPSSGNLTPSSVAWGCTVSQ